MKLLLTLFSIFTFTMGSCQTTTENDDPIHKTVEAEEFIQLMEDGEYQLLDVRTPKELDSGMITGASNIDYYADDFEQRIKKLDKEKVVMVYCASGGRSGETMQLMKELGFKRVYNLAGGYPAWEQAQK